MKQRRPIAGFSTVEFLMVIGVGLALIAGGAYAWRHQQPRKTPLPLSRTALDSLHDEGFVHIKEWGLQTPYAGLLHLSYTISGNVASFSSRELTDLDKSCTGRGGQIVRYAATDDITPTGSDGVFAASLSQLPPSTTSFALASINGAYTAVPGDGSYTFRHAGKYYYVFMHDQSACGSELDIEQTAGLQQQTNTEVRELVPALRPSSVQ